MSTPEQARATQLRNIEAKTGESLAALRAAITGSGKIKHGEIRSWLIEKYGLGYGDANGLAHAAAENVTGGAEPSTGDAVDEIYSGKKAHLRAVHDAVIAAIMPFGPFEIVPKKGYVAMRRKKQFAMLGPKTAMRAELGINLKADIANDRIVAQKPGGMCQFVIALTDAGDVDAEVVAALERAFDSAQ